MSIRHCLALVLAGFASACTAGSEGIPYGSPGVDAGLVDASSDAAVESTIPPDTSQPDANPSDDAVADSPPEAQTFPGVDFDKVDTFGSNPGDLDMFVHIPAGLAAGSPLVVVMHGCSQDAAGYAQYSAWNALADRFGFAAIYPQQRLTNNTSGCFNWFFESDVTRDQGEIGSIAQMIDRMATWYQIDTSRVFATGVSAGAAMAVALMAVYPDKIAGVASMAGLPFHAATTVAGATNAMLGLVDQTPEQWAEAVRQANPSFSGTYPRLLSFHGDTDAVVNVANQAELIQQWVQVHGLDQGPGEQDQVKGHEHHRYADGLGNVLVESYLLSQTGHGTPVDPGSDADQGGTVGTWFVDANLYSCYYACVFWGIAPSP